MNLDKRIWIDLLNPSHPLFFEPLVRDLMKDHPVSISIRDRGETIGLSKQLGLEGKRIGKDLDNPLLKTLSILTRTFHLSMKVDHFDWAVSLENPMSVAVSKIRRKRSVLILDNDLKMKIKGNPIQTLETRVKFMADHIIVPRSCQDTFSGTVPKEKLMTYDGYKEDFYIAGFSPDRDFMAKLPFEDYMVVRPEALASFYVENKRTIVPDLVKALEKEGKKVVFLARSPEDRALVRGTGAFIPETPLNGLDLIYNSSGVLTGSGTMSREGAVMGRPAVSFFPSDTLLSVDESMIEKGWVIHSRDVQEIISYLREGNRSGPDEKFDRNRSVRVKEEMIAMIRSIIDG